MQMNYESYYSFRTTCRVWKLANQVCAECVVTELAAFGEFQSQIAEPRVQLEG